MTVTVYTSPTCGYCRMLKEFLARKGIPYEERDVSRDAAAAQEAVRISGQNSVPVTVVDGQTVVGFDQPRLEQLLAGAQTRTRPTFGAAIGDARKPAPGGAPAILGAYVGKVRAGSVAEKMGLAPGDVIIQLDMQRIAGAADLERALSRLEEGSRFSVVLIRGNSVITAQATL